VIFPNGSTAVQSSWRSNVGAAVKTKEARERRKSREAALAGYQPLKNGGGEAQVRMGFADMLRLGTDQQRAESQQHAERAADILRRR
jgi:hypothetical protein